MEVSNCCGAVFYEPGYPDNDICTECGEHAGAEEVFLSVSETYKNLLDEEGKDNGKTNN